MPYTMPHLKDFSGIQAELETRYTEKRQERDKARILGAWLPETSNAGRKNDILFIQNICKHITDNKDYYETHDKEFAGKSYASRIAPFLKNAMSGAFMLTLSDIQNSYKLFTPSSALADVILDIFQLENFDALPKKSLHDNLSALKRYLTIMTPLKGEADAPWHPVITDATLMLQLNAAIARSNTLASSFSLFAASSVAPAENLANTAANAAPK